MNETTKNQITSAVTSLLMLLGGIPAVVKFLPPDALATLVKQVPDAIAALGTLLTVGSFVWKLVPKSQASIVKGAIEQGDVKQIEVTPKLAAQVAHPDVVAR